MLRWLSNTPYPYSSTIDMTTQHQTVYTVSGMTCSHCELSVREEVEAIPGVTAAKADRTTGTLEVTGNVPGAAVEAAVKDAGYEVVR